MKSQSFQFSYCHQNPQNCNQNTVLSMLYLQSLEINLIYGHCSNECFSMDLLSHITYYSTHAYVEISWFFHCYQLSSSGLISAKVKRETLGNPKRNAKRHCSIYHSHAGKYSNGPGIGSSAQWQKFRSPEYLSLFQRPVCSSLHF